MQAAAESGLAEIAMISDTSEQCMDEAGKLVPGCRQNNSFTDTITDPGIDGVVIATPSALHMQQSVQAFEQGKAVFCQKPLGRNAEEVQAVIDAARKADKLLGVDLSYRYTTAFREIYNVIRSGELGKIFAVDMKFHNAYGPDKPWFYDMEQAGGGCVLDLGIHLVDLVLYALGFPAVEKVQSSLYAKGMPLQGGKQVEDYANVFINLENDITATLSCSWHLHAGRDAVIEVSFYGTEGGVTFKNINGSFYDFIARRYWGTKSELLAAPPDAWGGRALIDWITRLSRNDQFDKQAEQFIASAKVLDKIYGRI